MGDVDCEFYLAIIVFVLSWCSRLALQTHFLPDRFFNGVITHEISGNVVDGGQYLFVYYKILNNQCFYYENIGYLLWSVIPEIS